MNSLSHGLSIFQQGKSGTLKLEAQSEKSEVHTMNRVGNLDFFTDKKLNKVQIFMKQGTKGGAATSTKPELKPETTPPEKKAGVDVSAAAIKTDAANITAAAKAPVSSGIMYKNYSHTW